MCRLILMDRPLHILIVEDDPATAAYFQEALTLDGKITTKSVPSLQLALEALQNQGDTRISALVLDVGLPDVEEMAGMLKIRAEYPLLPIVMVTGRGPLLREAAFKAGADDYLEKPIAPRKLIQCIRESVIRRLLFSDTYLKFASAHEGIAKVDEGIKEARAMQSFLEEVKSKGDR